ncbi:MAG: hypothetical protein EOM22_16530 [Gammaproteobacteria bacterium]|nr:hypothetical protein [Gammaproteobacteria bacterium]
MSGPAAGLTQGERIALLLLALAAVRPGADPRPIWLEFCATWRGLAAEIAAELPVDTELPACR